MHEFHYQDGELYCEATPVLNAAERYGTPLYLYSHQTLVGHFRKLRDAFAPAKPLLCFSLKANSSLALCRALIREGAGMDIVSVGELRKALLAGASPRKIVYASVGKTVAEIAEAVKVGIRCFNVESIPELEQIDAACRRLHRRQLVALRINPDVDPRTHPAIATGRGTDKFGVDPETARRVFAEAARYPGVVLGGVHIHIGSQITESRPFVLAIKRALALIEDVNRRGASVRWLNIGGGLGIVYHRERPQTAAEFARAVLPLLRVTHPNNGARRLRLILEPGRFIVGNSGILVTRVLYLKQTPRRRFAIVDAGMNDLIRPSLYGAYHQIVPVAPRPGQTRPTARYDVVGPICESGDFFAKDREMARPQRADLLAVMSAGAYGFTMASNYNSHPKPPEVLVSGDRYYVVRKRETLDDLINGEVILEALK